MTFVYFKGSTAYEWQIGRIYGIFPFWRFVKCGCWPRIGWDSSND